MRLATTIRREFANYIIALCRDGKEISVGPIEAKFFAELLTILGLEDHIPDQHRVERWAGLALLLERTFATEDQAYWARMFEGSDACVAPVLALADVPSHPHLHARQADEVREGVMHAAPAPRFLRTPGAIQEPGDADDMLARWTS